MMSRGCVYMQDEEVKIRVEREIDARRRDDARLSDMDEEEIDKVE